MTAEFMTTREQLIPNVKECRRPLERGTAAVCMDDRDILKPALVPNRLADVLVTDEKETGPQMPGASAGVLVAIAQSSLDEVELKYEELYDITQLAHDQAGFGMGVHMDNHHDEIEDTELSANIIDALDNPEAAELPGCGYAGMVVAENNPLNLKPRVHQFFRSIKLVPQMVASGAKLVALAGHHKKPENGALAIINTEAGTTLDHAKLKQKGIRVYGYDPDAAQKILSAAVEVLQQKGYSQWANNLAEQGMQTLNTQHSIAAKALTGSEPVEI